MSNLARELARYLAVRRSLGFDLATSERVLHRFVAFAETEGATHVGTALFLRWQRGFGRAAPSTWAARLGIVRLFVTWLHAHDPAHEVPPAGLIPGRRRRAQPYIFEPEQIADIVDAAAALPSVYGLRGLTFSTLFGLLATTGMRIGEAVALDGEDAALATGVLTIRRGKGGKTRLIPLHASVAAHLEVYARERDRLLGAPPRAFFVGETGTRVTDCSARYNFALVCQQLGLRPVQRFNRHGEGPRLHDLRHSFAARTLIGWYRDGGDPAREMIKLTTYLGHSKPENTYWYIEAVPELIALAGRRVETGGHGEDVR